MAMTSDEYGYFHTQLKTLAKRLDALEANSRNAASSDQPIVGPPSLSEDSRALARPEILAKLETVIDDVKGLPHKRGFPVDYRIGWRACCDEILQHLDDLDQGPVAGQRLGSMGGDERLSNERKRDFAAPLQPIVTWPLHHVWQFVCWNRRH